MTLLSGAAEEKLLSVLISCVEGLDYVGQQVQVLIGLLVYLYR